MDTIIKKEFNEAFELKDHKEYKKAYEKFKKLEESGVNEANEMLGHMYNNGEGVKKDLNKALEYYKKLDNKTANVNNLIGLLSIELGFRQEGLEYIQQAIDKGMSENLVYLGSLYDYGIHSFNIDKDKALDYYTKACANGYKDGCLHMVKILKEQNKHVYEHLKEYDISIFKFLLYSMFGKKYE